MEISKKAMGWLIVACAIGTVVAQTPPATPKPPAGAAAAKSKASLEPLLQQATDALAGGQYGPARTSFQDALVLDPKNVQAWHGLGICQVAAKEIAKAAITFDKALSFTTAPDRALVLNAAAAQMSVRAHMRAAKLCKDYLAAHPKDPDEPILNALGTALSAATGAERKNRFFSECTSFYVIANGRIEAARPGFKRFGSGWYPAAEAEAKLAAMAAQQKQLDSLMDNIGTAQDRFDAAEKELNHQKFLVTRGELPNNFYLVEAQYNYDAAKERLEQAAAKYDAVTASLNTPRFPTEILMVTMDSLTAPPLSQPAVTVASADTMPKPRVRIRTTGAPETGTTTGTGTTGTGTTSKGPAAETKTAPPPIALEPPKPTAPRKVRITQYAAAFPVAADLVVTSATIIEDGATLQLQATDGQSIPAELVRRDEKSGLALLRISGDRKLRGLILGDTFTGGPVTCASFPTVDLFSPAAQTIPGTAPAPKDGWTISLNVHPRLAGAPVIANGKVVGVCIAARDAERAKLPATTLNDLKAFLGSDAAAAKTPTDPASSLLQLVTTRETMGE